MRRAAQHTALLLLAITACRAPVAPPPPALPAPESAGLHVLLTWDAPVDLDLYVTDSSWETVYFGNTPSRAGGRLEGDVRCDTLKKSAQQEEWVWFPNPAVGLYRVGVDFIDACTSDIESVSVRVMVSFEGQRRERTGTVRLERFQPTFFELELDTSEKKLVETTSRNEGADDAMQ